MRILYLVSEDLNSHPGLHEKINNQLAEWSRHGHECFLANCLTQKLYDPRGKVLAQAADLPKHSVTLGRFAKLLSLRAQYRYVQQLLAAIRPDLTYARYLFPAPGLRNILKKAGTLILEINSDDKTEYFLKHRSTGWYNLAFRYQLLSAANGFVFVTNELARSKSFPQGGRGRVVIGNGMHVNKLPFVPETGNRVPQICFIGSPRQAWHGVDKLLALVEGCPDFVFHVIGPSEAECLELWYGRRPENVCFHGHVSGVTADSLLAGMDVGISTLALHRIQMHEACPLKTRKYLALGLPFISAYDDPDVDSDCKFVLRLPNTELNVLKFQSEIRQFVLRAYGDSSLRRSVRDYAVHRIDVVAKEMGRLNFFEKTQIKSLSSMRR